MNGRTIIVTGTSSGIGAYCARALKRDGWRVFATARRPEDIAALEADGIEAFYMDYTEPESIAALMDQVLGRTGGRLDALFNNGAYAQAGATEDLPTEALRLQFEANVFGWHDLTRRVVKVMRPHTGGRIVNCSSVLGLVPARFRGAYVASKHAIEGLMLCLRLELKPAGIFVSMIEPGPIESRIAPNGQPWFERFIDIEHTAFREQYQEQLQRMRQGGSKGYFKLGPEAVYAVLRKALDSPQPRAHYRVTVPTKIAVWAKGLLPERMFYRGIARIV